MTTRRVTTPPSPAGADQPLDPGLLDGLWNFGDPAGSEQRFRAAAELVISLTNLSSPNGAGRATYRGLAGGGKRRPGGGLRR